MLFTSITVLLPVLFVMGLGYWAGRAKKFDADQTKGLNELVLDFALPALMFVSTVTTTRSEMFAEIPFLLGILIAFVGLFLVVLLFSIYVLHHSLGEAALQANLVSYPSVAFVGIPIFTGLFGAPSILSNTSSNVVASLTIVPLTVVMLEIHSQRAAGNTTRPLRELISQGLVSTFKKAMVWAPLVGAIFVLLDLRVPPEITKMFTLIGSTTSGASIFLAGLIIAAYKIKFNLELIGNTLVKMLAQPALMVFLVSTLAIANPLGREAILLCALPTALFAPLLAPRYQVYESEAASTLVLTSLAMIVTLPVAILLTGA